ncbi:hypothetical protein SAMD00019534_081590 [Acytostelium subglobosum LB1]|uniref:hypothetical protein n=1 Tax=Acytostelium subglobosum LB1 TaxID=1410327 RepID=UPI000644DBF2|nr:hypothetical protein SAMD00019534_081590 [Acytostelium subglobosum LB1]GAM24984.1 hypothetical protein SAMD00019534_081590 [Acytostelium subglobosum LB1]|eukprot:XP_012752073.1 hypothetical protein SAMD00019534_081590 [Acytostelium subglobosum LB1]
MDENSKVLFGNESYTQEEIERLAIELSTPLPRDDQSERPGPGGTRLTYLESWKAIEIANRVFGFNGWSSRIVELTLDFCEVAPSGKWRAGASAIIRIMLKDGTFHDDVGFGMREDSNKGTSIEHAKKEAVSDARKRSLRVFGNALGNKLYDKDPLKLKKDKQGGGAPQARPQQQQQQQQQPMVQQQPQQQQPLSFDFDA